MVFRKGGKESRQSKSKECQLHCLQTTLGFLGGSVVKNQPAMLETGVRPLCGEDPLEKEMATHSSILAWKMPWTEKLGRLQSMGSQTAGHD